MGLHIRTIWVHYKASHTGKSVLPPSMFKDLVWNDFIVFFGMKNILETKNVLSFHICAGVAITSLTTVTYAYVTGKFLFGFFFFPGQLSVLKELPMKYWTSVVNIYLEQYNSLATSFSQKKNLDIELFSIGKKTVLINLFKTVLIKWKFVRVFHSDVSEWNISSFHFEIALYFGFDCPGILCYKTFKILLD